MRTTALLTILSILGAAPMALAQKGSPALQGPNIEAPARYATINLAAGFLPDPHDVPIEAGGELNVGSTGLGQGCVGWIDASRADVTLNYSAGQFPLYLSASSRADTTIVIRDPAGNWHCNDDFVGLDPGVVIQRPASGEYRIWVGTLAQGPAQRAVMRISEVPPRGMGQAPNFTAPARYATVSLAAGFLPDPHDVPIEAGGELNVGSAGLGQGCVGWIDASRADVTLNYSAGQFPLYLSASSRADTTIVIRDPAGNWHCNDDFVGLDPGVVIQRPASGEYRIWVGTLAQGPAQRAVMRISEVPPTR